MPRFFVAPVYSTVTLFARLRGLWLRPPHRGLTFAANPEIV
jgi:hypothetical protein